MLLQISRHPATHDSQTDKTKFHRSLLADPCEPRLLPNDSKMPSIAVNARRVSWLHIFLNSCHKLSGFCSLAWARLLGTAVTTSSSKAGSRVNATLLRIRRLRVALIASGVFAASTTIESTLSLEPRSPR